MRILLPIVLFGLSVTLKVILGFTTGPKNNVCCPDDLMLIRKSILVTASTVFNFLYTLAVFFVDRTMSIIKREREIASFFDLFFVIEFV